MERTIKIDINEYRYLIARREQIEVLERELKARVRDKADWIGIDALKTIFDLWEDVPEVEKAESPCDYQE